MSSSRKQFNRSMFAVADGQSPERLVAILRGEDIELLLDGRPNADASERLRGLCDQEEMYYVAQPALDALADRSHAEPDELHAWAARMALRHRTCLLGDARAAEAIAGLVGLRVIDLDDSPAPIALPPTVGDG